MPKEVRRAKDIHNKITERTDLGDGDDGNADEYFDEDDDDDVYQQINDDTI